MRSLARTWGYLACAGHLDDDLLDSQKVDNAAFITPNLTSTIRNPSVLSNVSRSLHRPRNLAPVSSTAERDLKARGNRFLIELVKLEWYMQSQRHKTPRSNLLSLFLLASNNAAFNPHGFPASLAIGNPSLAGEPEGRVRSTSVQELRFLQSAKLCRLSVARAAIQGQGLRRINFRRCPAHFQMCAVVETEQIEDDSEDLWRDDEYLSYLTMLRDCEKVQDWRKAIAILDEMQVVGIRPNDRCLIEAMDVCSGSNEPHRVLALFQAARKVGLRPKGQTFHYAIKASARVRHWQYTLSLLQEMLESPDKLRYIQNSVTLALGACREERKFKHARAIYESLKDSLESRELSRDFWDALIASCAQDGQWEFTASLLDEMQSYGTAPTVDDFAKAIMACRPHGMWQQAMALLQKMPEVNLRPDANCYLNVMQAAQSSKLVGTVDGGQVALSVLDGQIGDGVQPDCASFRTAMRACKKNRMWKQIVFMLYKMRMLGVKPDKECYIITITALMRQRSQRHRVLLLIEEMWLAGFALTARDLDIAIGACGMYQGNWELAFSMLDEMSSLGVVHRPRSPFRKMSISQSMGTINRVARACAEGGAWEESLALLDDSFVQGKVPSHNGMQMAIKSCALGGGWRTGMQLLYTMENAIGMRAHQSHYLQGLLGCTQDGNWEAALSILNDMRISGNTPDVHCYTEAIAACEKGEQWQRAVLLLVLMRASGVMPSQLSFHRAMNACREAGQWSQCIQLLEDMRSSGVMPTLETYTMVMAAYAQTGQWQEAVALLEEMSAMGYPPNGYACSAAIQACGECGQWDKSLDLIDKMLAEGLKPNVYAFNTAISACQKGEQWQRSLWLFSEMQSFGVEPNVMSYALVMDACAKAGQWQIVLPMLDEMIVLGLSPGDRHIYAVLVACDIAKVSQFGQMVVKKMRRAGVDLSDYCYASAVSLCANSKDWEDALLLLDEMRAAGLQPEISTLNSVISAIENAEDYGAQQQQQKRIRQGILSRLYYERNNLLEDEEMAVFRTM